MSAVVVDREQTELTTNLVVNQLEPTIGAEIGGVDLRYPLTVAQRDRIKALLLKHRVLFFRNQPINGEQQLALARQFGKIYEHPTTHKVTSGTWHSDTSWLVRPTWGAILRTVDIPALGGDTIWANGHAVYESLSDELKEKIENLFVVHDFQAALKRVGLEYPVVAHRLVRTHPETGEKIVWVNFSQNPSIVGWDRADSAALLDQILAGYSKPEVQVRFKWTPNTVAFWDNRAGLHYAVVNYGDYPRELERVLIEDFDALPHY
jgi:alpha-ketoglutarate-dependent taurine dioxygenase